MSDQDRTNIGYFVAAFGAIVLLGTMALLGLGKLDDKTIIILFVSIGAVMLALGMYVVVPKQTHEALNDLGELGQRLRPFSLRSQVQESGVQPAVVAPAPGQSAVVKPADAPPVAVGPHGEVAPVTQDDLDESEANAETATGNAMSLMGQAPPRVTQPVVRKVGAAQIGEAQRKRQQLYPPEES